MNIASIDRGASTPVDVNVLGKFVMVEDFGNLEDANAKIDSLESEIQHLEEQIYDLENEIESSEETVEELT